MNHLCEVFAKLGLVAEQNIPKNAEKTILKDETIIPTKNKNERKSTTNKGVCPEDDVINEITQFKKCVARARVICVGVIACVVRKWLFDSF